MTDSTENSHETIQLHKSLNNSEGFDLGLDFP